MVAVTAKIEEFAQTEDEQRAVKSWMTRTYGGAVSKVKEKRRKIQGGVAEAGLLAAGDFSITVPMGQDRAQLGHES